MFVFGRNVFKLLSGSVVGQALLLVALPVLSRIYSPEDFGIAQAALSGISVLLVVGALRLEIAVLSVEDESLDELFRCAWWICIAICSVAALVLSAVAVTRTTWQQELRWAIAITPLLGLLACWNQLLLYRALRGKLFGPTAKAKAIQPAGYALSALVGGNWPSSLALLVADALGRGAAIALLIKSLGLGKTALLRPRLESIIGVLRRHRELCTLGLIGATINAAGSAFTAVLMFWVFGAVQAGQYAMVERLVGMPVGLLATTISQVFMADLSAAIASRRWRSAQRSFRQVLRVQALTGLPVGLLLIFAVAPLITLVLGQDWAAAGEFARALIPLYVCSYIVGPLNMTLTIAGHQRLQLQWDIFRLALSVGTWLGAWSFGFDATATLWIYSFVSVVSYGTYVVIADRALNFRAQSEGIT